MMRLILPEIKCRHTYCLKTDCIFYTGVSEKLDDYGRHEVPFYKNSNVLPNRLLKKTVFGSNSIVETFNLEDKYENNGGCPAGYSAVVSGPDMNAMGERVKEIIKEWKIKDGGVEVSFKI